MVSLLLHLFHPFSSCALILISLFTPSLTHKQQGVNPTYMTKKGTEKPKMLKKGKKYPVKNGDHFCLLTTNYPYTVKIKNPPTPSNPSLTSLSSSQSQHESSQKPSKKPQQQQHHDSEEEEGLDDKKNRNDNNNNNSKKRKIEEDSDDGWGEGSGDETTQKYHNAKLTGKFGKHAGRGGGGGGEGSANPHNKPQCKYGAECYRRVCSPLFSSPFPLPLPSLGHLIYLFYFTESRTLGRVLSSG